MTIKARNQYSNELKREAVVLVVEQGLSVKEAAQHIGVPANYISRWKQRFLTADDTLLSCEERRELEELRKENKRLRMERDILKKAAAFFASHGR